MRLIVLDQAARAARTSRRVRRRWPVLDPGSSNGTQVKGDEIETGAAVPRKAGHRIRIGAWTALTLET